MVNPLDSPGNRSSCPPLPRVPEFWREQRLHMGGPILSVWTGGVCPRSPPWSPGLWGPLLPWHPLAKGWLSPALVPPAPTQVPLLGLLPTGVRCPWSASQAHALPATGTGRAELSWSLPATGSLPRAER